MVNAKIKIEDVDNEVAKETSPLGCQEGKTRWVNEHVPLQLLFQISVAEEIA